MVKAFQEKNGLLANLSLKARMSILVSLLILALAIAVGHFIVDLFEGHLKKSISQSQSSLVSSVADHIDDKLTLARQALVAEAAQIETAQRGAASIDIDAVQRYLNNQAGLLTLFDNGMFLFSSQGELLAESPFIAGRRGRNYAFRDYFKQTLATGQPVISSPYFSSKSHRHPAVMFTAPIRDAEGNLVAVLGGAVDLLKKNFIGRLSRVAIGKTGYLYLYDTDRVMIQHPDKGRILQRDVPVGANPLFDRAIGGFEGTGETVNSRGLHVLASFKRLKSTNWILAANYPVTEAYAGLTETKRYLVLILVPIGGLGLLVSLVAMHLLMRPLQQLSRHVLALSEKPAEQKLFPLAKADEVGTLARAFNEFVMDTEAQHAALIEARNLAETERAKSDAVIAAFGDGLSIQDTDFRVLYQNQVALDLVGNLVGQPCYRGIHQRDQPCPGCALARAFADGQIHQMSHSSTRGDRTLHVEITASPIRDAEGHIVAGIEIVRDVTERRRIENDLRNSEYLLKEAQRIARIGSFDLNLRTNQQHWSEELYRIHQLPPGSPVSYETVFEFNPPEQRERIERAVAGAVEKTGHYDFEHTIIRPDGTTRMMRAIGRVLYDGAGKPERMIGACQDITEQKTLENQLREQKNFAETLVQNSAVASFVIDAEHRMVIWNRVCEELTGVRASEVLGRTDYWKAFYDTPRPLMADLVLDQSLERHPAFYPGACLSSELNGGMKGEVWFTDRRGQRHYVLVNAAPVRNESGEVVAVIQTLQDITERQRSEERIRQLSMAVEQSPTVVVITDLQGQIEYVNPRFTETTGYRAEEVIGGNPSLLKSGHTPQEVYRELWGTLTAGKMWRGEFRNKKRTGELYWEQALIAPICDADGRASHYLALKEDITERRDLEDQLRHAQKMEAVGQLSGGIAHDFNNILTAIVGYANLQQYLAGEGTTLRQDMEKILAAADRGIRLTQDLLTFSRKRATCMEPLDLNEVVRNSLELVRQLVCKGMELTLTLWGWGEPLNIVADSNNLEQVLMNLASNARDAMPDGGRLFISTEPVLLSQEFVAHQGYGVPGPYALLSVSDTGTGMDKETVSRIFEPFFTTKEVGKGTGLGLSIIYGIVKQHKGFVICHSGVGQGTGFRVYLPLEGENDSSVPELVLPSSCSSETILLVEDEAALRKATRSLLEEYGYRVVEAEGGGEVEACLNRVETQSRCVIITSLHPDQGGLELYRRARAARPGTRVLFGLDADFETDELSSALPPGSQVVSMPFFPNQLLLKVSEVLYDDRK